MQYLLYSTGYYRLSHIYSLTDIQFIWSVPSSTTGSERTVSGGDVSFILRTVEKGVEKGIHEWMNASTNE